MERDSLQATKSSVLQGYSSSNIELTTNPLTPTRARDELQNFQTSEHNLHNYRKLRDSSIIKMLCGQASVY